MAGNGDYIKVVGSNNTVSERGERRRRVRTRHWQHRRWHRRYRRRHRQYCSVGENGIAMGQGARAERQTRSPSAPMPVWPRLRTNKKQSGNWRLLRGQASMVTSMRPLAPTPAPQCQERAILPSVVRAGAWEVTEMKIRRSVQTPAAWSNRQRQRGERLYRRA